MAFLDETGLATLRARLETVYERRDTLIGCIFWWSGKRNEIPANAKVCNGQSLLRSEFQALFAKIGTFYGYEDADHFYIPDLRIGRSESQYGKFIRARFADGTEPSTTGYTDQYEQDDAIRNITGSLTRNIFIARSPSATGAFSMTYQDYWDRRTGANNNDLYDYNISFSANSGGDMTGHAVATDSDGGIRPSNVSMIPIIIVS